MPVEAVYRVTATANNALSIEAGIDKDEDHDGDNDRD
jgi:hypothetical protein